MRAAAEDLASTRPQLQKTFKRLISIAHVSFYYMVIIPRWPEWGSSFAGEEYYETSAFI